STLYGTGGSFPTGEWVFAAAVYDGSRMRLYQNGVKVGSMSKSGTIDTNDYVSAFIGDNAPGSSRAKYLVDLERMRSNGMGDYRPFSGPLSLGDGKTEDHTISLLSDEMSTSVDATVTNSTSTPISHPGTVTTYQLYTGGPTYAVPQLSSSLSDESIEPDAVNNPLGVFRDGGQDTFVYSNTAIQGVLLFDGSYNDIRVKGNNVTLSSVELLPMDDGTVYELPLVIAEGDLKYEDGGGGTINGMVMAWDKMCLEPDDSQTLSVTGRVFAKELHMKGPSHWSWLTYSQWNTFNYYFSIWNHYFDSEIVAQYLPEFLRQWKDYDYNECLTVKPDDSTPNYHWHDWQNPIIVPHPDDPGLRWDLVEWTDNPVTD
ncbi:MAG: LamG domain-containing protein, partial [Pirellulales bacterium]|nr:LamG domain-containing protein [Pirellulales bacterium]